MRANDTAIHRDARNGEASGARARAWAARPGLRWRSVCFATADSDRQEAIGSEHHSPGDRPGMRVTCAGVAGAWTCVKPRGRAESHRKRADRARGPGTSAFGGLREAAGRGVKKGHPGGQGENRRHAGPRGRGRRGAKARRAQRAQEDRDARRGGRRLSTGPFLWGDQDGAQTGLGGAGKGDEGVEPACGEGPGYVCVRRGSGQRDEARVFLCRRGTMPSVL